MQHSGSGYRLPDLPVKLMALLLLFFYLPAFAQSSVWQISKNNKTMYIGGTVHVLQQDDYPLPEEFTQAFNRADKIVFETNMTEVRSPAFTQRMMQQMLYLPGQSLKNVLDSQTYERLREYFSDKIPMSQIDGLKPGMVVIMLSAIEFQRLGMVVAGVDEYFWRRAQDENKSIGTLETIEEQLAFIMNMGQGNENEMIMKTLDDIEHTESMISLLKQAWRSGAELQIKQLVLQEMIDDYPQVYEDLLVRRNSSWMPHIEAMLDNNEIELLLVGTLHLVGDDGLLQQLRSKGYSVSHF